MRVVAVFGLCCTGAIATANDHNNLEIGHPLRVEDAYSIAFGEHEFQTSFGLSSFNHARPTLGWNSEFQYGFAKNRDLSISSDKVFDGSSANFELSYFNNIQRELLNSPALAYRIGVSRQGSQSTNHLSLIGTRSWHQYDKVHVNLDLDSGTQPEIILGYSAPLGYPKVFDRTLVAEAWMRNRASGLGVGIRKQVDARSVLDVGLQSVFQGSGSSPLRATVGYSLAF